MICLLNPVTDGELAFLCVFFRQSPPIQLLQNRHTVLSGLHTKNQKYFGNHLNSKTKNKLLPLVTFLFALVLVAKFSPTDEV